MVLEPEKQQSSEDGANLSNHQENNKQPTTHYEDGVPVLDVQSERERQQAEAHARDEQYKNDQIVLNRRLVNATVALVVATILLGIISGIQLLYIHRQWKLTSDGLSKMGDQIWAAKDAAFAARQAADTANNSLGENKRQFTDTLGQMHDQTAAQNTSADAAKRAADIAKDSLVLANRPWIKVKHRIVKPLNFDFVGAAGAAATMTVEDTIENVGNGVALNVVSWEDVIPVDPDMSTTTARRRRDEWCDANKRFDPRSPTQLSGYSLFPKDPFIQYSGMGPLMSTVEKAVESNMANMGFLHKGNGPNPLVGKVAFVMVGCIVYRSPLDPDGVRPYMTGFLYHLGEPGQVGIQPFVTPKGTADKLQLVKFPDGDFAY